MLKTPWKLLTPTASDGTLAVGQYSFLPLSLVLRPLEQEFN
jgi:hypothetical protein